MTEKIEEILERVDRVQIGFFPTPLEIAERLTDILGGPNILFKRDDCTGLAFGGNPSVFAFKEIR